MGKQQQQISEGTASPMTRPASAPKPVPSTPIGAMMFTDGPQPPPGLSPYQMLLWHLMKLKERQAQIQGGVDG